MVTLKQIYNEKGQAEQEKEMQNVHMRSIRKCHGAKSSAQGDKIFKENPDVKRNRVVPSPHKLPICKNELKKTLRNKGNHTQQIYD